MFKWSVELWGVYLIIKYNTYSSLLISFKDGRCENKSIWKPTTRKSNLQEFECADCLCCFYLGSSDHQPPGQHLPGGAKGQVAWNTSGLWAWRCSGLLLYHQAAGQRQQPVRGPLCLATGVKGDQACSRKQGVLSKTQRCMLISPFFPSSLRFALILGPYHFCCHYRC